MKLAHVGSVGAVVASIGVAVVAWMWTREPIVSLEPQSSGASTSTVSTTAVPVREPLRADLAPPPGEVGVEPFTVDEATPVAVRDPRAILAATWVVGRVGGAGANASARGSDVRVLASAGDGSSVDAGPIPADGRFAMELRQRATFELVASTPLATSSPLPVEGGQGRTIDVGTLELAPRVALTGRVIDGGGRGVRDAHVRAGDTATTTDGDGAFALAVGAGRVRLEARASGYRPHTLDAFAPTVAPCVLELVAAPDVTGIVVDASEAPVDACEVRCDGAITRTDGRGAFRFAAAADERPFVVARHARRGAGSATFDGVSPLRIVLERTAAVVVTLDRALAAEAREVLVELLRASAGGATAERATFGIETAWIGASRVRVMGLVAGETYRIRVLDADGASASTTVSVPSPAPEIDLAASGAFERSGPIDVRVVDDHGVAVRGAWVTLGAFDDAAAEFVRAASTATDADGRARFTKRPADEHVVHVAARGRSEVSLHVARTPTAGDARFVTVIVRATSRVRGSLPRPADARAAPWIRASSRDRTRWTRASVAGTFAFDELAAEAWEFTLWPPALPRSVGVHGGPALPVKVLDLEPGRTHELTFVEDVSRAIPLHVAVVDELGRPLPAVRVSAWQSGAEVATARSAADGRAELVLPWVGRYSVRAEGDRDADPSAILDDVTCEGRAGDVLTIVVRPPR
ncbi:MAG: carboxypeptidase regulatory-like domain-containing protein [Planctomycetes bacterium]|nr:carboxypeptidase regulatory-like domain-containing protein [Planctomycetota bacterium]